MPPFLVTGYLRSGTTLLEKLLHSHPAISAAPQPFPMLYSAAKQEFLGELGLPTDGYPLGHLFLNRSYTGDELTAFLQRREFSPAEIRGIFEQMKGYSGWQVPELAERLDDLKPGRLFECFEQLTARLAGLFGKPAAQHCGAKEVFCEEFIPYFLEEGARVVLIVRDVRDVVASMNFGSGEHVGEATPTLYAVRKWRKSVAYALAYQSHPRVLVLRYEDLVRELPATLTRIAGFFDVPAFPDSLFEDGLCDQRGIPWRGNSSFVDHEVVDAGSVGIHRGRLPDDSVRFVESLAHPELLALGYSLEAGRARLDERALCAFREPVPSPRKIHAEDYSTNAQRLGDERQRVELISGELPVEERPSWFLFSSAWERLREAVASGTRPTYSVVVPVYDSTSSVVELVARIGRVFRERIGDSFEIILIDDASPNPETWPTLTDLSERHSEILAIQLMRNFGKAGAILCGLEHATGRWVVTIDDDLQQLPEELPLLLAQRHHDVVVGAFNERQDGRFERWSSAVKGWFDQHLIGKPPEIRISPYKLFERSVVRAMLDIRTAYPFIPALIYHVTRDVVNVEVSQRARAHGRSGFTFRKRFVQFLSLLINNSSFLLRLVAMIGILMSLISAGLGGFVIAKKLLWGVGVAGWTSLVVIVLMAAGLVLFSLGVIGEYLIRIINGIEARQPYVVRTKTRSQR